jgi:hypothetical protein
VETGTPEVTLPPTNSLAEPSGPDGPNAGLLAAVIGLAGLALVIGFTTPVPAHIRRRSDRNR